MTPDGPAYRQSTRNQAITSLLAKWKVPESFAGFNPRRSALMDRRGEGVPLILDFSEKLSGQKPLYETLEGESCSSPFMERQPIRSECRATCSNIHSQYEGARSGLDGGRVRYGLQGRWLACRLHLGETADALWKSGAFTETDTEVSNECFNIAPAQPALRSWSRSWRTWSSATNNCCGARSASAARSAQAAARAGRQQRRRPARGRTHRGQPGAAPHPRADRSALPVRKERQKLAADERTCPDCGRPYCRNGQPVSERIEVEVQGYVRWVRRACFRAGCECAQRQGQPVPEEIARPPPTLFRGTHYELSVWVWFLLPY